MSLLVTIHVDRAAAILAAHSQFGAQDVVIDPSDLTATQREELADAADASPTDGSVFLTKDTWPNSVTLRDAAVDAITYPKIAEATEDTVRVVLDARAQRRSALAAAIRAYEAEENRKRVEAEAVKQEAFRKERAMLDKWLHTEFTSADVAPVKQLYYAKGHDEWERRSRVEAWHDYEVAQHGDDVLQAWKLRIEELKQKRNEARQQEANAARVKEAARRATIDSFVAQYCNPEQQRRAKAGLLGEPEILQTARNAIFQPLDDFSRFQQIGRSEVRESAAEYPNQFDRTDVEFTTWSPETVGEAEFKTFEDIRAVCDSLMPNDTEVKFVVHAGRIEGIDMWEIERLGVLVTVVDGEVKLSREYACP